MGASGKQLGVDTPRLYISSPVMRDDEASCPVRDSRPHLGAGTRSSKSSLTGDIMLILLIVVLILLFGGGGGYYYGRGAGWRGPHYGGGLLGLVLIILLVLWLTGTTGPGMLR